MIVKKDVKIYIDKFGIIRPTEKNKCDLIGTLTSPSFFNISIRELPRISKLIEERKIEMIGEIN